MKGLASFIHDIFKTRFVNVDSQEKTFETTINRYLKDWESQVQSKITEESKNVKKDLGDLTPEEIEATAKFKIGSLPKRLASLASAAAQKGIEQAYTDMNLDLAWDINMTPLADYYLQHYTEFSKILSTDLQERIKNIIAESVKEGWTTDETHQAISSTFNQPITIKVPEKVVDDKVIRRAYEYNMDKDVYTTMVARSEIQRALNNGRVYGYQESNLAKTLRWVANPGACEECQQKNGSVYDVEDSEDLIPYHPNCYSKDTYVLTNKGWKLFTELKGDELFLSINPNNLSELEYVKAKKYIKYPYSGDMIHMYQRNFDLLVTPTHNMYTIHALKYGKLIEQPASSINKWSGIYRSSLWEGKDTDCIKIDDTLTLTTADFCNLLGYFLSEGSTTVNSSKFYKGRVFISQRQGKKYDKIYEDLKDLPLKVYKRKEGININSLILAKYLSQFGDRAHNKFIPSFIKELSPKYINIFLDAFCLGDGHIRKSKYDKYLKSNTQEIREFFTTSCQMYSDICELLVKVGKRPSVRVQKPITFTINGKTWTGKHTLYRITECHSSISCIKNIKKEHYNDFVYDVELEKWHTLYIMRKGKCAWSGNCRCTWIVSEYKSYEETQGEQEEVSDKYVDPEQIVANPNGLGWAELFKMPLDDLDKVIKMIDEGGIEEALKFVRKFSSELK